MKNLFVLMLVGAGTVLASPVLAKDPPAKIDVAAAPAKPTTSVSRKTRYCLEYNITGSIITRKDCRTRDQWLADGVDPVAK